MSNFEKNDLYITNHQPLRPVAQPIQHYRPEILGTNSDDRSFLAANTNIYYPGMHPAQAYDQYMSSLDQVSGRGRITYYKPRYPWLYGQFLSSEYFRDGKIIKLISQPVLSIKNYIHIIYKIMYSSAVTLSNILKY